MMQTGKMIIGGVLVANLTFGVIACVEPATSTPRYSPPPVTSRQPATSSITMPSATPTRLPTLTTLPSPTPTLRPTLVTSAPQGRILFTAVDTAQAAVRHWQRPWPHSIWIINVDSTGHRRWIESDRYTDGPHVSPDGTQVVYYESSTEDEFQPASLWIANVDGTHRRPVDYLQGVTQPKTVKGFGLESWSPNGEWLSYYLVGPGDLRRDPVEWLYVLHLPSGRTTLVCGPQNITLDGQWIPTEETVLAFTMRRNYDDPALPSHYYRVNVTQPQNIHKVDNPMPQWTATGQMWTYSRDEPAVPSVPTETFTGTIKILAPNGSVVRQISIPDMRRDVLWSPDSQWIVYRTSHLVRFPKGEKYMEELWIVDSYGRRQKKLLDYKQFDLRYMPLIWSPDSAWLAGFGIPGEQIDMFGNTPAEGTLFLVNVSTGKVITLLERIEPYLSDHTMVWIQ